MKTKNTTTKRIIVSLCLFLSVVFSFSPQPVHADVWGAAMAATMVDQIMTQIKRQIEGMLLGTLKMAAIQMLNNQVGQLVGGGAGGQARFITNFDDFIIQGPRQRADLYMNDFFTLSLRGRGSSANYVSVGNQGGMGGNYDSRLRAAGVRATTGSRAIGQSNLSEYTASPQAMFAEGDFRAFNAFFSNPYNNPYGYSLEAERFYQGKLAEEQQTATVEAQSSGFLGAKQGNNVVAPASSIEAAFNNAQDLPNKIIASASNPAELLSGIVGAMATRVVNNLVQKGIGQVQSNIQRQIGGVNSQVGAARGQAAATYGPGGIFRQDVIQKSIQVNPGTSTR